MRTHKKVRATKTQRQIFLVAANMLAELGRCGLYVYVDDGSFHLMSGPSHDHEGGKLKARQDRILESVYVPLSGGGGW